MKKKLIFILKMHIFMVKVVNHSIYINVVRIRKINANYCVKLDHVLYSINYGILPL